MKNQRPNLNALPWTLGPTIQKRTVRRLPSLPIQNTRLTWPPQAFAPVHKTNDVSHLASR